MVLIELEPEPEPEATTRPTPPVPEEQVPPEAARDPGLPLSPPPAEEQAAASAGGEAPRAVDGEVQEEEEAFEDALTDEQLREVGPERPQIPGFPFFVCSCCAQICSPVASS